MYSLSGLPLVAAQVVELAWDASSRLLAAAAGNDVLVW